MRLSSTLVSSTSHLTFNSTRKRSFLGNRIKNYALILISDAITRHCRAFSSSSSRKYLTTCECSALFYSCLVSLHSFDDVAVQKITSFKCKVSPTFPRCFRNI